MRINTKYLKLIPYSAAGNVTPVLDLSYVQGIENMNPKNVRSYLEKDRLFRGWLQEEGRKINADSVMIFYRRPDNSFVTFIGEPNAPIDAKFSDMCGNGIRSLALHIVLMENDASVRRYINEGINIFAGDMRNVKVEDINIQEGRGDFRVQMGNFQTQRKALSNYVNFENLPEGLHKYVGFNGTEQGEPHLVYVLPQDQPASNLRDFCADLGRSFTSNTDWFPHGINFNAVLINGNDVHISTHERNLSSGERDCLIQQKENGICKCCTQACGTGGAAAANILINNGLISGPNVKTIHAGGEVEYIVNEAETIMIGPAMRLV